MALKVSLEEELERMDEIATMFLKTYQVWHYRRLLLTALNSVDAAARERLSAHATFETWETYDDGSAVVRFVTSWATREEDVDALIALL